MSFMGMREI